MKDWNLEENKLGNYYWFQTSHYFYSKNGQECSRCGKIRKYLLRINYPKACNIKDGNSGEVTKGYPKNNPYKDWLCKKCWRSPNYRE